MDTIKLNWATHPGQHVGNLFGYATHNTAMFEYVSKQPGIEMTSMEDAEVVLYITAPGNFNDRPEGKLVILCSMWEGTDFPDIYHENLNKADYLMVPSTYVKELFSKYFPPEKIYVVQEGVKLDFRYKERKNRPKHFRYLWVGAPNPRKGWQEITSIWEKLQLHRFPNIELYLKTSGIKKTEVEQRGNVIVDPRVLSLSEMVHLYQSAHCFVWPTRGEGFGLPLAEAMSTGLPCVCTYATGVKDFFDDKVGYPVFQTEQKSMDFFAYPGGPKLGTTTLILPDPTETAQRMIQVYEEYPSGKPLYKGKLASIRIKRDFTWDRSAEIFVNAVKDMINRERANGKYVCGDGMVYDRSL